MGEDDALAEELCFVTAEIERGFGEQALRCRRDGRMPVGRWTLVQFVALASLVAAETPVVAVERPVVVLGRSMEPAESKRAEPTPVDR